MSASSARFRVTDACEGLRRSSGVDTAGRVGASWAPAIGWPCAVTGRLRDQFDGFVYPAFNQIVAQLAKMRIARSHRSLPVVIRIRARRHRRRRASQRVSRGAVRAHGRAAVFACGDPADAYVMTSSPSAVMTR